MTWELVELHRRKYKPEEKPILATKPAEFTVRVPPEYWTTISAIKQSRGMMTESLTFDSLIYLFRSFEHPVDVNRLRDDLDH